MYIGNAPFCLNLNLSEEKNVRFEKNTELINFQLIYGIRYLDIRAGFNDHTAEKFWTMHDFVAMNPLYKVCSV